MSFWQKIRSLSTNITIPTSLAALATGAGFLAAPHSIIAGIALFSASFALNLTWVNALINRSNDLKFATNKTRIETYINNLSANPDINAFQNILDQANARGTENDKKLLAIVNSNNLQNLNDLNNYIRYLSKDNSSTRTVSGLLSLAGVGILGVGYYFTNSNYSSNNTNSQNTPINSTEPNTATNINLLTAGPVLQAGGSLFVSSMQLFLLHVNSLKTMRIPS